MNKSLKKFGILIDTFLLLGIMGIFGISLFTVVNLTPGYENPNESADVLGVSSSTSDKGLMIRKIAKDEDPLDSVEIVPLDEDNYSVRVKIAAHKAGQYYLPLIRVINNNSREKKIDLVSENMEISGGNSNTYLLVNNEKYSFDPRDEDLIPYFNIETRKSFDVGIYINSESNVNFDSELEFVVRVAE